MAAGDTQITIAGNLVDDPELRFTPAGQPVARFRVASTPRFRDNATGEWKDGDSLFLTCNVWRQAAENVAESLTRGMRVIVSGRLRQRSYETKEGEKRTVYEVEVDDVGPSLRNASAKVNRAARSSGNGTAQGGQAAAGWPEAREPKGHRSARARMPIRGRPTAAVTATSRRSRGSRRVMAEQMVRLGLRLRVGRVRMRRRGRHDPGREQAEQGEPGGDEHRRRRPVTGAAGHGDQRRGHDRHAEAPSRTAWWRSAARWRCPRTGRRRARGCRPGWRRPG